MITFVTLEETVAWRLGQSLWLNEAIYLTLSPFCRVAMALVDLAGKINNDLPQTLRREFIQVAP